MPMELRMLCLETIALSNVLVVITTLFAFWLFPFQPTVSSRLRCERCTLRCCPIDFPTIVCRLNWVRNALLFVPTLAPLAGRCHNFANRVYFKRKAALKYQLIEQRTNRWSGEPLATCSKTTEWPTPILPDHGDESNREINYFRTIALSETHLLLGDCKQRNGTPRFQFFNAGTGIVTSVPLDMCTIDSQEVIPWGDVHNVTLNNSKGRKPSTGA